LTLSKHYHHIVAQLNQPTQLVLCSWEYPARQGIGCSTINSNDTANFLLFLQELRLSEIGKKLTISSTGSIVPFTGPSGEPVKNVAAFAEVLDYLEIMNYDVWGSWSSAVGPNAPLDDSCAPPAYQVGSAVSAVKAWTNAGMPKQKIVLGVPAYGHSFYVTNKDAFVNGSKTKLAPYPAFNATLQPKGDVWQDEAGYDVCGVWQKQGGNFALWGLVDGGFITSNGKPAKGIKSRFDNCSQTVCFLFLIIYFLSTELIVISSLVIPLQRHFERHDFLRRCPDILCQG
jgi:chitinase